MQYVPKFVSIIFLEIILKPVSDYLSQRTRVLLQKLTVTQPVKKFLAFYGTRRFITVFTTARQWSLS
jgi:hypothetical protein